MAAPRENISSSPGREKSDRLIGPSARAARAERHAPSKSAPASSAAASESGGGARGWGRRSAHSRQRASAARCARPSRAHTSRRKAGCRRAYACNTPSSTRARPAPAAAASARYLDPRGDGRAELARQQRGEPEQRELLAHSAVSACLARSRPPDRSVHSSVGRALSRAGAIYIGACRTERGRRRAAVRVPRAPTWPAPETAGSGSTAAPPPCCTRCSRGWTGGSWRRPAPRAGAACVAARARCSAGAGGCWADPGGAAFLSMELSVFAPRLACTTVWLNAASQETQSEYAGVRAPLLRVFNEDGAHITWASVAHVPLEAAGGPAQAVLLAAWGTGPRGALAAWPLGALRPPPVLAAELGDLRERVRLRARRPPPADDAPPPDEATVRALCTAPEAASELPAPPVGFMVEPSARRLWAALSGGGAWCAELPGLRALRHLAPPGAGPAPDPAHLHYVQPAVSDIYVVSPRGACSGEVGVWCARSGTPARAPPAQSAPALAALLPPPPPPPHAAELLVLAGEHLCGVVAARCSRRPRLTAPPACPPPPRGSGAACWSGAAYWSGRGHADPAPVEPRPPSHTPDMAALVLRPLPRVPPVFRRAVSRSCDGPRPHPAQPCRPAPSPACRPRPPEAKPRGVRVVCCAPPQGARPPCEPPRASPPLTCADRTGLTRTLRCAPSCGREEAPTERCGRGQDRVARRLECAKAARRADYEREAAERSPASPVPLAPYTLGEDRVCSRATDGREYVLPCAPPPATRCGPDRAPPPPRCVPLQPDDACRPSDGRVDPCAHRPRVFIEIDRGARPPTANSAPAPQPAPQRSLTSRIMDGLGRSRRPSGPACGAGETSRRRLHTSTATNAKRAPYETEAHASTSGGGLAAALRERASLAEAGRGHVAPACGAGTAAVPPPPVGRLELPVPSGAARISVCVSLTAVSAAEPPTSAPEAARAACGPPSGLASSWLSLKTIHKRFVACHGASAGSGGQCSPASPPRPCSPASPPRPCTPASPPRPPPCQRDPPQRTPCVGETQSKHSPKPSPCTRETHPKHSPKPSPCAGESRPKLSPKPSPCAQETHPKYSPKPSPCAGESRPKLPSKLSPCAGETHPKHSPKPSTCSDKQHTQPRDKTCFSSLKLMNEIILVRA